MINEAPEITLRASDAIASWRRVLDATIGDKRTNFTRGAVELLRLAEQHLPPARQAIIDAVAEIGTATGLDDDEVQAIMAAAKDAPPDGQLMNGGAGPTEHVVTSAPVPLDFLIPATWSGVSIPPRRWLVRQRVPLANVTMLAGDGASGKTTIALQLAVATVRGTDWLGSVIEEQGPVIFLTAEEDRDEIHRRLASITEHQVIGFADLPGLHVLCMPGSNAELGAPDRAGIIRPTALFASLLLAAVKMRPALIAIEAAADVYAGNENDRGQARQFVSLLRRLAIESGAAVMLIAHPSMSGLASGTGTSGSTAWNNSVRSRLYFTGSKNDETDADVRELRVMKSNYGPAGEIVRLRWQSGVFVPIGGAGTLERVAAEAAIDHAFLDCLDVATASGRDVSEKPSSVYAPAVFEKMTQAKGLKSKALAAAQERLFSAGRIEVLTSGPPSKPRRRIARKAA